MAYLDLRLNQELTGTIPTQIGQLTALTWLSLSGIQMSRKIATQFVLLTDLRYLYLSYNELTGTIPTQLGQLTGLKALYMHENPLTGSIPATLPQSTDLDFIFLYNNFLTGQVPSAFCAAPFPDWRADGPNLPGKPSGLTVYPRSNATAATVVMLRAANVSDGMAADFLLAELRRFHIDLDSAVY